MRIYPTMFELAALVDGRLTQLRRPQRLWHGAEPQAGQRLFVAEPYVMVPGADGVRYPEYRHDTPLDLRGKIRWHSAVAMPEAASRFPLRVTRVESGPCRLLRKPDLAALGYGELATAYATYQLNWQSDYGKASWDSKEKVWIVDVEPANAA
jgi:hypothetical protein